MLGLMALLLILFQDMLFILYYDCSDLGGIVTVLMLILIVSGNRCYSVMICLIGEVRSLISHAGSGISRSVAHVGVLLTMHNIIVA